MIEVESTKRQGRSLGPADCGRISIGARQEVVSAVGDRVHEKPLQRAHQHHREDRLLVKHRLDNTGRAVDEATLLVQVPRESDNDARGDE